MGREAIEAGREPLVDVDDARAERPRLRGAEQRAVVLEGRAAAGRVHDDRRVARHRRDRPARERRRAVVQPGVDVQRAAARRTRTGDGVRRTRQLDQARRVDVGLALPCVHHAAGEQPDVVAGRRSGADRRSGSRVDPSRCGTRRTRWPTASTRSGEQQPVRPSTRGRAAATTATIRWSPARADRVPSISAPNGTPLGHAGSQPRHCTHVSMKSTNVVVGRASLVLHRPHRVDPAARRVRLLPRRPGTSGSAAGRGHTPRMC